MTIKLTSIFALLTLATVTGCGGGASTTTAPTTDVVHASGAEFLLDASPDEAKPVIQAREAAHDDEEIVVLGRIGGSANPWIEGRAAFSIVDPTLTSCSDRQNDSCPTPWDYCCESSLPAASALVKIVDDGGQVVKADARKLLGVKELDTVVVRGTAQRDDAGNLTVLATGVYVQK